MLFQQSASAIAMSIFAAAMTLQTVTAQTPPQFSPAVSSHLSVSYGTTAVKPAGITVPGNSVTKAPALELYGDKSSSYIAILMDFSVAGILPDGNTTLIHWIQGNLTASTDSQNLASSTSAIAPYAPPGPPAGQTHTYGVFLYAQPAKFAVPADYIPFFNNLTASIFNRVGFNLTKFAGETGLAAPVAADWFLVSTPKATTSSSVGISTATGTGAGFASSTTGTGSSPTQFTSEGTSRKVKMIGFVVGLLGAMINIL